MKLATIEKITNLRSHENADALEIVEVLGYQAVVPIRLHKEGDLVVYIQPDTVLPKDQEWAEEYIRYSPKRVKAVRLRGEWSEGVVAPLSKFDDNDAFVLWFIDDSCIGEEVSDAIGVVKYEPPLPKNESAVGGLPYQMSKTDEERFENMLDKIPYGEVVDISLKYDGQSSTHGFHVPDDRYFLTGRRFEINSDEENRYSVHCPKVRDIITDFCKKEGVSLAFRGESYGNGIQASKNNVHSAKPHSIAFFSIYNVDERRYERKGSKYYFVDVCDKLGLERVEILEKDVILTPEIIEKYSKGIKKLPNGNRFEGVVVNHANGSFKIINKFYDADK
jgi:RNA ligase (TIGR02306 family)